MGILDSFEKGLERAVNGAFAKTFKSGVQPLEVTAALRRELDTQASVVARDRILVPNRFTVRLAPLDFERLNGMGSSLMDEFRDLVKRHAAAQHYAFAGPLTLQLQRDPRLSEGVVAVDSEHVKGEVAWTPVLDIGAERHPLVHHRTVLGRGSEADILIDDPAASRRHVEVLWDGTRAQVRDLASTNGTRLDGVPLDAAPLPPDSVIQVGQTRIVFRVLAQEASVDQFADLRHPKR